MRESTTKPFQVERLGLVMQADPAIPEEIEGVLNPAAARGPDGHLYLFPRTVGRGNYSRIGLSRVLFDDNGNPTGVERIGYALEPQEPYERRTGTGGCEDPRVTYVEPLHVYVMAYVAWGAAGPRIALAVSDDLFAWRRLGPIHSDPDPDPAYGVDFDAYHNKDGVVFPRAVSGPDGRPSLALLHRPVYEMGRDLPRGIPDRRPSIWISYCALDDALRDIKALTRLSGHHLLLEPQYPWEELRIGAGTPPLLTPLGWLVIHHGVRGQMARIPEEPKHVEYMAGALVLDEHDPRQVRYRSSSPILVPETGAETDGVVPNVVFPTATDTGDRGNGWVDIYYGMADLRIGAARLHLPKELP
jgi:predicted GH43/DUF377 family glycosyl hydrolase